MEVIEGVPYLSMKEAGEQFVALHGGDLKKATDVVLQRLRAMDALVKRGRRVFAPESTVTDAIQKPPSKAKAKRTDPQRIDTPKETHESSNQDQVHVAYCAGYIQRFLDEYASGYGLPAQALASGVSRLLSGQKDR